MATRYPARSATVGQFTVQSARKDRNTMTYHHFVRVGKGPWIQVDSRVVAKSAGLELVMPSDHYKTGGDYEALLLADVQYIAGMLQHDVGHVAFNKFMATC